MYTVFQENVTKNGPGWCRVGEDCCFRPTDHANFFNSKRDDRGRGRGTLSFTFKPSHGYDKVYFAFSHPYTCTQLERLVRGLRSKNSRHLIVDSLCLSPGGRNVPLLTITQDGCRDAIDPDYPDSPPTGSQPVTPTSGSSQVGRGEGKGKNLLLARLDEKHHLKEFGRTFGSGILSPVQVSLIYNAGIEGSTSLA